MLTYLSENGVPEYALETKAAQTLSLIADEMIVSTSHEHMSFSIMKYMKSLGMSMEEYRSTMSQLSHFLMKYNLSSGKVKDFLESYLLNYYGSSEVRV